MKADFAAPIVPPTQAGVTLSIFHVDVDARTAYFVLRRTDAAGVVLETESINLTPAHVSAAIAWLAGKLAAAYLASTGRSLTNVAE